MRERSIYGTDLRLTELAFGSASLGNLFVVSTDDESRAAVDAAWDGGIRYFDTAPHYGLGLSERRLGAALAGRRRDEFVVSSKVGRVLVPNENPTARDPDLFVVPGDQRRIWDFSRDGVLRSIDDSLTRMGLDRLDIVYLHDVEASGITDAVETGAAALAELREQGVVRAIGIGSQDTALVAKAFRTTDIDVAMLAGRYTLVDHSRADEVFEAAGERSVVAVGAFNSGLLARPRPAMDATYDYTQAPTDLIAKANHLADIAERHGVTLPQAAIAFPLRNPGVRSVAIGMRTAEEVRENLQLAAVAPPESLWEELRAEGLVPVTTSNGGQPDGDVQ